MNALKDIAEEKDLRFMDKCLSYLPIYERLLHKYVWLPVVILEIGIRKGGSLQLWKRYFGSQAQVFGVDIMEHTLFDEPQIKCILGDQGDRGFLNKLAKDLPAIDIIIDDGSHFGKDQVASFEELFPHLKSGGLYFCEDLHTSYRSTHDGGYKRQGTMVEYCKGLLDSLHANEDPSIKDWGIEFIEFHPSLIVIKKR